MKSPSKQKCSTDRRSKQSRVYSLPNNAGSVVLYYNTSKFKLQQKWRYRNIYDENEAAFVELLTKKSEKDALAEQKLLQDELQRSIARNEAVARLFDTNSM